MGSGPIRESYLNKKQELFCRFIAGGETQTSAYEMAGYSPSTSNAHTMANKPDIKKRIAELKEENYEREIRFKKDLAAVQATGNKDLIEKQVEWTVQRVMDMMAENVRLAQVAGEYRAANETLKMMAEGLQMFESVKKENGNASRPQNSITLITHAAQILEGSGGGMLEDRTDPLAPRIPSTNNAPT